jgi:uncharacterized membrane protein YhaH (DUF805 family)
MSLMLTLVAIAVMIIWAITIGDIVRRRLDVKRTAGWILLVVLVPVLGSLVYWALRKPTADELQQGLGARADLPHERARPPSQLY